MEKEEGHVLSLRICTLWRRLGHNLENTTVLLAVTSHFLTVDIMPMNLSCLAFGCSIKTISSGFSEPCLIRKSSSVSCSVESMLHGNGSIAREIFWNQILSVTQWRHPLCRTAGTNVFKNPVCCLRWRKKALLGKWEEADNSLHTCSLTHWCPILHTLNVSVSTYLGER